MTASEPALPFVDQHAVEVDADPAAVWGALLRVAGGSFAGPGPERVSRLLGCRDTRAAGDLGRAGSTLPGFTVLAAAPPVRLVLGGGHRFAEYALFFEIRGGPDGRSRLAARTRAEFPGRRGRAYRAAVIGSRGHVVVVRRLLGQVRSRAERD